jgi:hypothetical protein
MQANMLPAHIGNTYTKRLVPCPTNGCEQASIPADTLSDHRAICESETLKCGFGGGKCNGAYKRGVGSKEHDR